MTPHIGTAETGLKVELPNDAVTQGFAFLARRRSGKSNLAGVMEETFCRRGDPWVCLDPVSAHWGVRYLDDKGQPGKPSGHDVLIVGGKYGDVPLDEKGGASLAQILVDTDISCVVDLGGTSMNARQKYVADFAIELLRINETPRHVLLEEADEFVPQQLIWDNQKLVRGALTRLIKQGGGLGIGYTLISQRPASVAKDVLEQVDNLIVLRMSGPRDLKAVQDWFEHNVGDAAEMKRILGTLRGFQPGEAWWLSDDALLRMKVRERVTYHAGRTPKRGEKPVTVKRVELGKVIEQFRSAAEKRQIAVREEHDLKAELAAVKRELAKKASPAAKPCDHGDEIDEMRLLAEGLEGWNANQERELEAFREAYADIRTVLDRPLVTAPAKPPSSRLHGKHENARSAAPAAPPARIVAKAPSPRPSSNGSVPADGLSRPQQRILNTLATFEALSIDQIDRSIAAVFSDASPRSSSYANNLGHLSACGFIAYPRPGVVGLTDAGRAIAVADDPPSSVSELHDRWFAVLRSGPQERILRALIDIHPDDIGRDELAQRAEASPTSSSYANNLGRLSTLGLLARTTPGRVAATDLLFPEGL